MKIVPTIVKHPAHIQGVR